MSVVSENDFIEFNVCGKYTKECAGVKAPACLTKDGKHIRFGNKKQLNSFASCSPMN